MELEQSFWKQTLFIKYPDKTLLAINFSNTYATILKVVAVVKISDWLAISFMRI